MTRRWSLSLGLVDGRNEGLWMLYGKISGQGGSENEQSKWWTVEHGMPRGARKWEMFGHRDFVNRDCVLRLTPQERVKWCRKRAYGRKKRWDERRLWSKRSRYEPGRRNPLRCWGNEVIVSTAGLNANSRIWRIYPRRVLMNYSCGGLRRFFSASRFS